MDFQSAMETFAEAWVAANTKTGSLDSTPVAQTQALSLTRPKTPPSPMLPERNTPSHKVPLPHMFNKEPFLDSGKASIGKSLPVHCIVENVATIDEQTEIDKSCWRRKSNVEIDSYVIIPVNTIVQDLVLVALTRLGYPKETAAVARGAVLIRNWRPLSFDTISPGPLVTVGELLGELSTIATLRIQIVRPRTNLIQDIKDKLLKLLLVQSHHLLVRSGCPLDTLTLTNICRDNPPTNFLSQVGDNGDELRHKFDAWISGQLNQVTGVAPIRPASPRKDNELQQQQQPSTLPSPQYPTNQKTRMRTSFDPELELPKLQKWFLDNQHPSRQQIQQYVKELNSLDSRRGRKPLDINNVVYWFKNARAAQKRAELRGFCTPLINMNGFHGFHNSLRAQAPSLISSDQHSNSDDDLSRTSDNDDATAMDLVDHESPLSLTNHKRDLVQENETEERKNSYHEPTERPDREKNDSGVVEIKQEPADCGADKQEQNEGETEEEQKDEHVEVERTDEGDDANDDNNNDVANDRYSDDEDVTDEVDDDRGSIDLRRKDRIEENDFRTGTPSSGALMSRLAPGFPLVPNSMFSHSIMYMSHYMPGLSQLASSREPPLLGLSQDERRKRNRTFIDPVTEVPRLEQWFSLNTHPSHNLILKYTEELNRMPYRQKFPRLEPKNVQFWFKNRRAKCKRLKMSLFEPPNSHYQQN